MTWPRDESRPVVPVALRRVTARSAIAIGGAPKTSAKIWVGRHQEIEEYLRTAECVSTRGSSPMRCTLRPGGPVARMAWRTLTPGSHRGFFTSYKAEIAAYELDKLLKLDMVPPTVERQFQGSTGAAICGWRTSTCGRASAAAREEPPEWNNSLRA